MALDRTHERFRTTSWTEICALTRKDENGRREAMEILVNRYWPPVYAYLRARGQTRNSAAEQTQAFFVEVVFGRDLFRRADRRRGRLRSLLLASLKNYRRDQGRRRAVRGSDLTIPLEQLAREDAKLGASTDGRVDLPFERRWAMGVLEEAMRRCEAHFRAGGRAGHWELFEARVLTPAISGNEQTPLAELAGPAGFNSATLAAAAVQVVTRRIHALLREVVAETLEEGADVDAELAEVRRYLSA